MKKIIADEWKNANQKLDEISTANLDFLSNNIFATYFAYPFIENTKFNKAEAKNIAKTFGGLKNPSILEVGAGWGNLCRCIHDILNVSDYTILDTKSMIRFSSKFLNEHNVNCNFVDCNVFENLFNKKFDIFVSLSCLSETPEQYRIKLLNNVLPNCSAAYIIDGDSDRMSYKWIYETLYNNFDNVIISEIKYLGKQKAYIATKKSINIY